ncbi:MAG: lysophospholipid acyltransferase family protein [Candidatus Nomurabacteria bacterium]|nr:lysophospholipid acyltransferase family protein [Candidatus Nomurabacteria bacterium]
MKSLITFYRFSLVMGVVLFIALPITIQHMLVDNGRMLGKEFAFICKKLLWAFGGELTIDGKFPKNSEKMVVMINHTSRLDIILTTIYFNGELGIPVVAKKLFWIPILRFWLKRNNAIGVNRKDPRDWVRVYKEMEKVLQEGKYHLFICPEGERSLTREMLPFKLAIFKLVAKHNKTILPVSVIGAFEVSSKKDLFIVPGPIFMVNKEIIKVKDRTKEELAKVTKEEIQYQIDLCRRNYF